MMRIERRNFFWRCLAAGAHALLATAPLGLHAQAPRRMITLVVPTSPGSSTDIFARLVQPRLQASTGVTVVVENKPGASASIAAELVARADKDGSKLLFSELSASSSHPAIIANLRFDPLKDLQIVAISHFAPLILAVNPNSNIKSVAELVAFGKANPGKLSIANSGIGILNHIAAVQLAKAWGVDVTHVPYPGGARGVQAVLTGEVTACLSSVPVPAFVERGQLRGLAVSGVRRLPKLPDLPLFSELPTLGPGDPGTWREDPGTTMGATGLVFATGGTPQALLQKISDEVYSVLETPEVLALIATMGAEPRARVSLSDATKMFERNIRTYTAAMREAGIKPQ